MFSFNHVTISAENLEKTLEFYRKFGYDYKNGVKELDEEHHYRLEKFKEAGQ